MVQSDSESDSLLLYMIYQMDDYSLQELLQKYDAYNKAQLHFYMSKEELEGHEEDCLLDLSIAVIKAIYAYRQDQNARFSTYYHCYVLHYIANYRRRYWSRQGRCRRQTMSLDMLVSEHSGRWVGEAIANRDITLEGTYVLYQEQRNQILKKLLQELKPKEIQVILWKLDGHSYEYICKKLHMDYRQVEYILAKVRKSKALID